MELSYCGAMFTSEEEGGGGEWLQTFFVNFFQIIWKQITIFILQRFNCHLKLFELFLVKVKRAILADEFKIGHSSSENIKS